MITNTIKINIRDNCVTDIDAIIRVNQVMTNERCSNNGVAYCFCTKYNDGVVVIASKKKYDVFDIYKEREIQ